MSDTHSRRLAIVHDYFCNLGGSDAVARALHELFPQAPVYTLLVYARHRNSELLQGMDLRTSFLQRLPLAGRTHQPFLPLMPFAIERFDFSGYDLVLSSSHTVAKGIRHGPATLHICYCHTPMRYAWDLEAEYLAGLPWLLRGPSALLMHALRQWDVASAARVDHFIANSNLVARRIWKYYRRRAVVIPPPVDTDFFSPSLQPRGGTRSEILVGRGSPWESEIPVGKVPDLRLPVPREDFYLVISRLVRYKRADLAIAAFNRLKRPLVIIGDGAELPRLRRMAGPHITFLGAQPRAVLRTQLARCRGLIFPGLEDFGIVPLEAQAMGCPVIAYGAGGALDSVIPGVTGIFFQEQTVDALAQAVQRFEALTFEPPVLRDHARQFDRASFDRRILDFVSARCEERCGETVGSV